MSEKDAETAPAPEKKGLGSTATRLLTAAPLIPILLWLMFWAPPWGFLVLVLAATFIAGDELMAMTMGGSRLLRVAGVLATAGFAAAVRFAPDGGVLFGATAGLVVLSLVASLAAPDPIETASGRMAWLIAGPIYVGGLLGSVAVLHDRPHGGGWVLLAMFLAWLSDTTAYFAGRALGRHKLYPRISPKKTIEGAVGGLVGAILGAVAISLWLVPGFPVVDAVALAVVAGAVGQAGDLFASLLKRSTGVKDSGKILPGHGGLLDRVDAFMFTAAITWAYVHYILPLR